MSVKPKGNKFSYDLMIDRKRHRGTCQTREEAMDVEASLRTGQFLQLRPADFLHLTVERNLLSTNVGSISELIVCAHALAKGYDAFRTVSSHSGCDVVIISRTHRRPCRIEVKTVHRGKNGAQDTCGTIRHQLSQHDVLAAVTHDTSEVIFKPDLAGWFAKHGEPIPPEELSVRKKRSRNLHSLSANCL